MNPVLRTAREKLKDVTPLKRDCGRVCGAACCRSPEGEETGMLLFPGEEEYFRKFFSDMRKYSNNRAIAYCDIIARPTKS